MVKLTSWIFTILSITAAVLAIDIHFFNSFNLGHLLQYIEKYWLINTLIGISLCFGVSLILLGIKFIMENHASLDKNREVITDVFNKRLKVLEQSKTQKVITSVRTSLYFSILGIIMFLTNSTFTFVLCWIYIASWLFLKFAVLIFKQPLKNGV